MEGESPLRLTLISLLGFNPRFTFEVFGDVLVRERGRPNLGHKMQKIPITTGRKSEEIKGRRFDSHVRSRTSVRR